MKSMLRMVFAVTALSLASASAQRQNATCDRTCLEGLMSDYLTALTAHDPSRLPLREDVTYVENGQFLSPGEGEWLVAGSPGKYRHVFSDLATQQVAAITTITENNVPLIYVVRLKRENDGTISEIETQITRDATGAGRYEKMGQPDAVWLQTVPPAQRISRALLVAQTNRYYTGMERNDPKGNYSFFDKDCNRLEDGLQTTNMGTNDTYGHSNDTVFASLGCEAQFQTGFLGFVTKIRDRRYSVVDEERQAVLAITIFDHNGTVRTLPSVNGTSSPIPPYFDVPRTLEASEAFRLRGDKLYRIEMTLTETPYGMRSAFFDDSSSTSHHKRASSIRRSHLYDESFLQRTLDQVLQAILHNNFSGLALAQDVQYSENGQFVAIGDGLWETLSNVSRPGVDNYAAHFTDLASGTAAYWGLIKEQDTPGVLALRIKLDNDTEITEIEAVAVRAEYAGTRGGTLTLMRPPLPVEWEGKPLGRLNPVYQENSTGTRVNFSPSALVKAYFDGLEQHSVEGVPLSPGCARRDNAALSNLTCAAQMNGQGSSPNGLFNHTTTVRDRRILVADTSKGVVVAVAMIDNSAVSLTTLPATERIPSTYMVPQLIKINNGFITRVESMIR